MKLQGNWVAPNRSCTQNREQKNKKIKENEKIDLFTIKPPFKVIALIAANEIIGAELIDPRKGK